MGVGQLPTKTDGTNAGEVGRVLADRPRAFRPDVRFDVVAAKHERLKDQLIENATAIGTTVSPAAGSLEARVVLLEELVAGTRLSAVRFAFADDFFHLDPDVWTTSSTGNGSVKILAGDATASEDAAGVLEIITGTIAGASEAISPNEWIRADSSPRFRTRVQITGTLANGVPLIGLASSSASGARFSDVGGNWQAVMESEAGGGAVSADTGVAIALDTWVDLRVEVDDDSEARFFVDETLVATLTDVNARPRAADEMGIFFRETWVAGTGPALNVDLVEVFGTR